MNKEIRNAAKEMTQPELSEAIKFFTELRSAKVVENREKAAELRLQLAAVTVKRNRGGSDGAEEAAPKKSKKSKKNKRSAE